MRNIFVFLLLCCFTTTLLAQQEISITGKVVDEQQQALIGATVYWDNGTNAVITNEFGAFTIAFNPNSTFLIASYVGYTSDSLKVKPGKPVLFTLQSGVVLNNVVVEHKQSSTFSSSLDPMKVQTMTETELFKAACCNLSESFETNPSVDVSFTDAVTGTKQIQMLGLAGPYIQISRENMPDIRGLSAIYGLTFVPGTFVKAIHLNKGAGSVVNGFESITGQIDVQLQNPGDMDKIYVNFFTNESERKELNLNLKQKVNDKWSTALLLHGKSLLTEHDSNNDGFLDMPTGNQFIALNRWELHSENGIHFQVGAKGTYVNNIGGQKGFSPLQTMDTLNPWGMEVEISRVDAWAKLGKVNIEKPWQSVGFQTSGTYHDQTSRYGLRTYNGVQKSGYANLIFQSIIDNTNNVIKAGASVQYDDYAEEFNAKSYNRIETVPGVFGEYSYTHDKDFSLVAGLRADYHSEFGAFVTPRLHLRYAPTSKLIFRASGGRGQRTANIFSENSNLLASSRTFEIQGNGSNYAYGLLPEIAWNVGGNITRNFKLWYRKGAVSVDIYRTQFQNQVIVDIEQNAQKVVFYNLQGKSYSNSFQTQVDYELVKRLDMRLAYRWYDVQTTYNGTLEKKPFVSSHRAFANFAYNTRSHWSFDYTLQWQGSKPLPSLANNPTNYQIDKKSPSFFIMNAQISKSWNEKFDVYIGAENLLGFIQENPIISSSEPYSKYFDSSLIWGPIYGREIYAGLRYRIK